jgi:hypothetical protein
MVPVSSTRRPIGDGTGAADVWTSGDPDARVSRGAEIPCFLVFWHPKGILQFKKRLEGKNSAILAIGS